MKIITHNDIENSKINPSLCYEWVSDMIKNKNRVILPAKTPMNPTKDSFITTMPSLLPDHGIAGVKIVSRFSNRIPALDSQILLYDSNNGDIKAILDGNYITTMRTGAVAAHSIKLLAKKDFETIGMVGLGNQARATIQVLLSLFPDREIRLKLKEYKNHHILFKQYVKKLPDSKNITFEVYNSYSDTIRGSDVIISSVTYFDEDICEDDCFDAGCLLVPIHTRGFMNCDLFFDKIFADDTDHVRDFKYFNEFKDFAEISDICNNLVPGRTNDSERILVYNIGLSMHDIYFAERIYQIIESTKKSEEMFLYPPKDKFWI